MPRDVAGTATLSSLAFAGGHGIREQGRVSLLLTKDLKLIKPKDRAELSQHATELKRMLTALLVKLKAER